MKSRLSKSKTSGAEPQACDSISDPGPKYDADFRLHLQRLLLERCRKNPAYSLRAMARQLKLEPSFLSKLLSGKRKVTVRLVQRLAPLLLLSPDEEARFKTQARAHSPSPEESKEGAAYRDLTVDAFQVIADWHHYAILELTKVAGFRGSPEWIAPRLGISRLEATAALERLERLEMLVLDSKGKLSQPVASHSTISHPFTTTAFRKLQGQILLQALGALTQMPMEVRDQSSMTMAMNPKRLPEARRLIKKFRRELCELIQSEPGENRDVYQLSVSLFPARAFCEVEISSSFFQSKGVSHE